MKIKLKELREEIKEVVGLLANSFPLVVCTLLALAIMKLPQWFMQSFFR